MKRVVSLLLALIVVPAMIFAVPVAITWEWALDDPDVTTFRYQLDGEDPDSWNVVDASVLSYTAEHLDGNQSYSLYLQQSYDGVHFSSSAVAASLPLEPEAPEVVVEPAVVIEEPVAEPAEEVVEEIAEPVEEAVVEEIAEPVEEAVEIAEPVEEAVEPVEEVVEEPVIEIVPPAEIIEEIAEPAKPAYNGFEFAFDGFAGGTKALEAGKYPQEYALEAGLNVNFNNILRMGRFSGIGLQSSVAFYGIPALPFTDCVRRNYWDKANMDRDIYADMLLTYKLNGKYFGLVAKGGMFMMADNLKADTAIDWGFAAGGDLVFNTSAHTYLTAGCEYRYFYDSKLETVGGRAGMGFRF